MAVPEGYTALARLGYADKGNYAAGTTYMTGDVVYHNGSSYVARKDNLKGVTPTNGNDWKYLARGFAAETMTDVQATDTNGVLGTAGAQVVSQALIDAIADRVMTKLVERSSIVQTESTDPSTVPSSPYFKQVTDKLTSDLTDVKIGSYTVISNSYVSITTGSLRKVGKMCQIYLSLNIQQTGGGYASFMTFPTDFLPLELGYFDIPKCTIQVKANQLGINATATGTTALYFTYLSK